MTYSEFANFDIIDTEDFLLLAGAELEDWHEFAEAVESTEDQAGSDE